MGYHDAYTEEDIEKIGKELIDYIENHTNLWHLSSFTETKKQTPSWLYSIARRHPQLRAYIERAKKIIGNRMLQAAFEKSTNSWIIKTFVPRYLRESDEDKEECVKEWVREDIMLEARAKAEAAKEAMIKEPEHPYWAALIDYMKAQSEGTPKPKTD
jgi:hypothetical protein